MASAYGDSPLMPMGQAAQAPLQTGELMQPPAADPTQSPGAGAPPPAAAGMMGGAGGMNPPGAPAEPPYDVKLQPDGSSIYVSKTQPPVVLAVNPPPKLPKALAP